MAKIQEFFNSSWSTLLSVVKIALQSRPHDKLPMAQDGEELVILGNGPSLNDTMANSPEFLASHQLLAVNFFANSPAFTQLKPNFYVLTDPHFFVAFDQENVAKLWNNFVEQVSWKMSLFIPTKVKATSQCFEKLKSNPNIKIYRYNITPLEGFSWFENLVYKAGLGMPRPRNVLIPSLMLALGMNYKTIYLAGADHSWTKTLSVDDDNNVVSIQPHFYKEDDKELKRVRVDYMKYPLHQIMYSFYVAFRSYFTIKRYAEHLSANIFNITPNSFIDAFPRKKI